MNTIDTNEKSHKQRQALLEISLGSVIHNYLQQNDVKEIMLNPDGHLWVETMKKGKFSTGHVYTAAQTRRIIFIIASINHKNINKKNPVISGSLHQYRARFQGWLPPITAQPTFCIRKQTTQMISLEQWVAQGSLTNQQSTFLKKAVRDKKNIIICGGTGSGKTTLTNTLLQLIGETNDRIIVIEDTAELYIHAKDHVSLLTTHGLSMRNCLAGTLRMRPDRIIIGEVRDGAALDLLKAWNTGHNGGIATLHANSPSGALQRLEDLSMEASAHKPYRLIAEVVHFVIYIKRTSKGLPFLDQISKICGHDGEHYLLEDVQ